MTCHSRIVLRHEYRPGHWPEAAGPATVKQFEFHGDSTVDELCEEFRLFLAGIGFGVQNCTCEMIGEEKNPEVPEHEDNPDEEIAYSTISYKGIDLQTDERRIADEPVPPLSLSPRQMGLTDE